MHGSVKYTHSGRTFTSSQVLSFLVCNSYVTQQTDLETLSFQALPYETKQYYIKQTVLKNYKKRKEKRNPAGITTIIGIFIILQMQHLTGKIQIFIYKNIE